MKWNVMADNLPLGTLPLAPSLKKGGGMSSDSPSERSPSLFQGWGWVLKDKLYSRTQSFA